MKMGVQRGSRFFREGVRWDVNVNERLKLLWKLKKKTILGRGVRSRWMWTKSWGIKVFVFKKKSGDGGGHGECERRFEVFVKCKKKISGGGAVWLRGVRVDKWIFLWKIKNKYGGGGWVKGEGGKDGCEQRIEAIVKIEKKKHFRGRESGVGQGGFEQRIEVFFCNNSVGVVRVWMWAKNWSKCGNSKQKIAGGQVKVFVQY